MRTEAEKLRYARTLIEKGWTQGAYAVDENGRAVSENSTYAKSFCAVGACLAAKTSSYYLDRLISQDVVAWNDTPGRTKEEVLDIFDRAIALAEKGLRDFFPQYKATS